MAIYMWREYNWLCFTANTAGSTVKLQKYWSPTVVNLEISTDWSSWRDYNMNSAIWETITLTNIWDKVYFRNKSSTPTEFSKLNNYYYFKFTGSIAASWDITFLLCNSGTDTLQWDYCFMYLFANWSWQLTTPPKLTATTLTNWCYANMFSDCYNLTTLPSLPATTLPSSNSGNWCYYMMFSNCSKIKISSTQTWEYQTPYRIPTTWTWTNTGWYALNYMFNNTWWTFKPTPTINTTYYTSNTVV